MATCIDPVTNVSNWLQTTAKGMGDAVAVTAPMGVCEACFTVPQPPFVVNVVASVDPNAKVGMVGTNNLNYIQGDVPIPYTIYFENIHSATAPASEVYITDVIDTTTLDLHTLKFLGFGFSDSLRLFDEPIATPTFSQDVDLRPERNTIVRVRGTVNYQTATVDWKFTSFDPETMDLTEDVFAGFLPPNVTKPEGEGFVRFTIEPKVDLTTATSIQNQAIIVFDANAPIATPVFTNTIDQEQPLSAVNALDVETNNTPFTVSWTGNDAHSGVAFYNVYVSDNGGDFTLWLANTPLTAYSFSGLPDHQYGFYSIATDNAGNQEAKSPVAEAFTTVTVGTNKVAAPKVVMQVLPNPATDKVTLQITASATFIRYENRSV